MDVSDKMNVMLGQKLVIEQETGRYRIGNVSDINWEGRMAKVRWLEKEEEKVVEVSLNTLCIWNPHLLDRGSHTVNVVQSLEQQGDSSQALKMEERSSDSSNSTLQLHVPPLPEKDDTDITEAQVAVLQWASMSTSSFEKIGFVKKFAEFLAPEEIKRMITMLTNLKHRSKRKWKGPSFEEAEAKERKVLKSSETPFIQDEASSLSIPPLPGLPASPVPVCPGSREVPKPWWTALAPRKSLVVGYDTEQVHLKDSVVHKVRGGKVAVVDWTESCLYYADIYHKPGSFSTHKIMVSKSGISANSLKFGKPMLLVTEELLEIFKNKLVIVCGGGSDFSCVDITTHNNSFQVFDLQDFYKQITPNETLAGMSLRDIFFMEFGLDFQGTVPHSPIEDARATIKIFFDGYVRRNKNLETCCFETHKEVFFDYVRMRKMNDKKQFFCNTERKFKDWNVSKCYCVECRRLFSNMYL